MNKVIVTGPTGEIGIALINELISNNIRVLAICHKGSKRNERIPKSDLVDIIEADLDELKDLSSKIPHDFDVFYHLAWACTGAEVRNKVDSQLSNVSRVIDAVELAYNVGCHRFVGVGSQAEYGRYEGKISPNTPAFPESAYGIAKLCAGQMSRLRCNQLGMEHIWARVFSCYGPYDGENSLIMSLIRKLLSNERPHCTKGEQIWDYVYSKDLATAFRLLGEKGVNNTVYCVGGGQGVPLREYITKLYEAVESDVGIGFGDIPYSDNQIMHLTSDIADLQNDTGYEPRYSFEEGIRETIDWVKGEMQ